MKVHNAIKAIGMGRKLASLSVCMGSLLCGTSAMATVAYTYENDDKTLVATVTDADAALTTSAEEQAMFTASPTNFVKRTLTVGGVLQKRGDYTFGSGTLHVSHPIGIQIIVR